VRRTPLLAFIASVAGCVVPFDTPSEYEDQRYLCAPEHADAFASIVDECRTRLASEAEEDRCAGAWSLTGVLGGYDVTIESKLATSTFAHADHDGARVIESIDASGPTPYFTLSVQVESVGGGEIAGSRELLLDQRAETLPDALDDANTSLALRLSGGGDSENLVGETGSGAMTVSSQSLTEIRGSFEGAFGHDGEPLQGCFHLLALETRVVTE
jgi:hypothetical protein